PPLGTGHALQTARAAFAAYPHHPLLVVSGDVPLLRAETLQTLVAHHQALGAAASLLSLVLPEGGTYGRVLRTPAGDVRAIVQAKDASPEERAQREVNAGVYVFTVPALLSVLDRLTPQNAQGEYYLTDLVGLLVARGERVSALVAADPDEALGVNTR